MDPENFAYLRIFFEKTDKTDTYFGMAQSRGGECADGNVMFASYGPKCI